MLCCKSVVVELKQTSIKEGTDVEDTNAANIVENGNNDKIIVMSED